MLRELGDKGISHEPLRNIRHHVLNVKNIIQDEFLVYQEVLE